MGRDPSRREGYERVVAQYGRPLLVYVARLLGSASEAEDVVQDVFVRFAQLWRGPLEPDARMTAWLRTTAHNLAVDAMRASARRAELHRRGAEERGLSTPPSPGQGGADALSDGAAAAAEALASLPPRERELVVLKVVAEGAQEFLEAIEDEAEFDRISGLFMERLGDEYDFEDESSPPGIS